MMDIRRLITRIALTLALAGVGTSAFSQEKPLKFAFVTDTHISLGSNAINNLRDCIRDINSQDSIAFVLFGGDLTDFGTDDELALVKSMIDSLNVKYYAIAGNHDANWSESGCNTMLKTFGYEKYEFHAGGWRFIGCNSGPDMRMAPALVPRESMVWLDQLEGDEKTIFINHYPMDSSALNYFDVTRLLKKKNVQFEIGGHVHQNMVCNYEGLPAVLCRSGLSTSKMPSGYNIVRLSDHHISFSERRVYGHSAVELPAWYEADLAPVKDTVHYDDHGLPDDYPWLRYDVNEKYPKVKEVWTFQDNANIVAGSAIVGDMAYYTTASGCVRAVSLKNGKQKWTVTLPGKIFSTPATDGNVIVLGCTDGGVYALNAKTGKTVWNYPTKKAIVACPAIRNGRVFIGSSDGTFRCLDLSDGRLIWQFEGVDGHVVSVPVVDDEQVAFGSWGRTLYSLDPATGRLQWKWTVNKGSRMYSPAACIPVKSHGRIFVAVPDRKVYAINAKTGVQDLVIDGGRDAIGISEDGNTIFSKCMKSQAYAIAADATDPDAKKWYVDDRTGYELAPSALVEKDGVLLIPTDKGNIMALSAADGSYLWAHKFSIALVNPLQVWTGKDGMYIFATAMDGKVTLLKVEK